MDSTFWLRFITASGIIGVMATVATLVGTYYFNIANRAESDKATGEIKQQITDAGDQSVVEIQQTKTAIIGQLHEQGDSINDVLRLKARETVHMFDELNSQLKSSTEELAAGIGAVKNPLKPLQVEIDFETDISQLQPDVIELLLEYKRYMESLGTYPVDIYQLIHEKKLPHDILLQHEDERRKIVSNIKNKNWTLQAFGSQETSFLIPFRFHQDRFLGTFLPGVTLFFLADREIHSAPEFSSDLIYELINYSIQKSPDASVSYDVDFMKRKISFSVLVKDPTIRASTGKVTSLRDCRNGLLGFKFSGLLAKKIAISNATLRFGSDYATSRSLSLQPRTIEIAKGIQETYFIAGGKYLQ